MNFNWTRECLFGVEFFTEHFWQHLVHSDVGQKQVVILEELSFVFELLEVSLQPIKANYFSNTRDVEICDLSAEIRLRILNNDANSSVVCLSVERMRHFNLHGSWSWLGWYFCHGKANMDVRVISWQQTLSLIFLLLLEILLECFYGRAHLFGVNTLFNSSLHFRNRFVHCFLVFHLHQNQVRMFLSFDMLVHCLCLFHGSRALSA